MMLLFFRLAQAWAEEGGHEAAHAAHHGPVSVPWASVFVQGYNFFFLVGLLVYLLHGKVKAHFSSREQEYTQLVRRAEAARAEAERGKIEIEERLKKLEVSAAQTVQQAQSEAAGLKARLMQEARAVAAKLEAEATRTTEVESEKAKSDLRRELLEKALAASNETLRKKLGVNEQKQLQKEFAEKIQVVGG